MTRAAVTEPVRELIRAAVDSYEKLSVLEVLFRAEGAVDLLTLCERVRAARDVVQDALEGLWHGQLVVVRAGGMYAYERGDSARDAAVTALFQLLAEDPVELSRLLDRAAMERARSALNERLTAGYAIQHVRHHGKR